MAGVVAEALRAEAVRGNGLGFEFELLGPNALDYRAELEVLWEDYADGGEWRLRRQTDNVTAVAAYEGRVCSGSLDGSIRMWGAVEGAAAAEP